MEEKRKGLVEVGYTEGSKGKKQNQVEMIDTNPYTMPGVAAESVSGQVIQNGHFSQSELVEGVATSAPPGVLQSSEENGATIAFKDNEVTDNGLLSERRFIASLQKGIVEMEVRLCEQIEMNEALFSTMQHLSMPCPF
jgi:hypothetical protein